MTQTEKSTNPVPKRELESLHKHLSGHSVEIIAAPNEAFFLTNWSIKPYPLRPKWFCLLLYDIMVMLPVFLCDKLDLCSLSVSQETSSTNQLSEHQSCRHTFLCWQILQSDICTTGVFLLLFRIQVSYTGQMLFGSLFGWLADFCNIQWYGINYHCCVFCFQQNAKLAFKTLSLIDGLKPVMPQGAMYLMVSFITLSPGYHTRVPVVMKNLGWKSHGNLENYFKAWENYEIQGILWNS